MLGSEYPFTSGNGGGDETIKCDYDPSRATEVKLTGVKINKRNAHL